MSEVRQKNWNSKEGVINCSINNNFSNHYEKKTHFDEKKALKTLFQEKKHHSEKSTKTLLFLKKHSLGGLQKLTEVLKLTLDFRLYQVHITRHLPTLR